MNKSPHKIVIVGGGAGGLELATRLGKAYGRGNKVVVTLVDEVLCIAKFLEAQQ